MNELWAQLMKTITDFWASNSTAIIAGSSAFIPTMIAILKSKAASMFKRKSEEATAESFDKDAVIQAMTEKMDEMELARAKDMRVMGEAFNTAFTNSNLAPEHKLKITEQLNGLSGVSDTLANTLKEKTASIVETTKADLALDKVSEEIKAQGTSILSKFLNSTDKEG